MNKVNDILETIAFDIADVNLMASSFYRLDEC